jgi:hypothetical protein
MDLEELIGIRARIFSTFSNSDILFEFGTLARRCALKQDVGVLVLEIHADVHVALKSNGFGQ